MLAWIAWRNGGLPRVRHRVELLGGLPLCRVEIGGRMSPLLRLLLRREERTLRRAGVREGVWSEAMPPAAQMDLAPVDVSPLRRAMLPLLLEQALRQKRLTAQTASVRLAAEGTSLPVYWAAQVLAQRVRYLHLDTGYGQAALEQWLRQRYGLAAGGAPPQLEVSLCRSGQPSALLLGENCQRQRVDYISPPALRESLPQGREGECLLAALWRQNRLSVAELAVERIYFSA